MTGDRVSKGQAANQGLLAKWPLKWQVCVCVPNNNKTQIVK